MSQQEQQTPTATLKEELRALSQFMETAAYQAFYADFKGEYELAVDDVWCNVPQTKGAELEREQKIGAAKYMKEAYQWFGEHKLFLEAKILERETPIADKEDSNL